jgi:dihydropteroate synthase
VLIGHSRKRFLAKVLGRPVDERTSGTIGVSLAVAALGADIIRIHDVRETRDALLAWHTILRGLTVPE